MNERPPQEVIDFATRLTLRNPDLNIISDTDEFPWFIRELQRQLQAQERRKELLLPNLKDHNETVAIFSDYGGESPDSKYHTYSILICAWDQTIFFSEAMQKLREEEGLNEPFKEIAFKDLDYGPVGRAIKGYLKNLGNLLNGYLLTIVVEKTIGTLFGASKKATQKQIVKMLDDNGFGKWKPKVAEKILRITHFAAYLVALLSREGQKLVWMTDNDAIAPTEDKHIKVLNLFSNLLNHYCKHKLTYIEGALPFKTESPVFHDLLSAPDLVAGAVEHYYTRSSRREKEPQIKEGANQVLCWLAGQGVSLKRHSIIIRMEGKSPVSGNLKFELKEPDPEITFIPIHIG